MIQEEYHLSNVKTVDGSWKMTKSHSNKKDVIMKKWILENKVLACIVCFSILAVILSLSFYIGTFHNHSFSENPSDWTDFAGYVGGLIGTLFSGFSLVYLIYINNRLFKQSDEHNRLQIIVPKIEEVYDELVSIKSIIMRCDYDHVSPDQQSEDDRILLSFDYDDHYSLKVSCTKIDKIVDLYLNNKDFIDIKAFSSFLQREMLIKSPSSVEIVNCRILRESLSEMISQINVYTICMSNYSKLNIKNKQVDDYFFERRKVFESNIRLMEISMHQRKNIRRPK